MKLIGVSCLVLAAAYQAKVTIELEKEDAASFLNTVRVRRAGGFADSLKQIGQGLGQVGGSLVDGVALGGKAVGNAAKTAGKAVGDAASNAGQAVSSGFCGAANWNCGAGLRSVGEWEEFKEDLEDTPIPEAEVDNLEKCVSACWWTDKFMRDPIGIAFEENSEKWEKNRESYTSLTHGKFAACKATNSCPVSEALYEIQPIPCGQCCAKIPNAVLITPKLGEAPPTAEEIPALRKKKLLEWDTTKNVCGKWYQRVEAGTFKP